MATINNNRYSLFNSGLYDSTATIGTGTNELFSNGPQGSQKPARHDLGCVGHHDSMGLSSVNDKSHSESTSTPSGSTESQWQVGSLTKEADCSDKERNTFRTSLLPDPCLEELSNFVDDLEGLHGLYEADVDDEFIDHGPSTGSNAFRELRNQEQQQALYNLRGDARTRQSIMSTYFDADDSGNYDPLYETNPPEPRKRKTRVSNGAAASGSVNDEGREPRPYKALKTKSSESRPSHIAKLKLTTQIGMELLIQLRESEDHNQAHDEFARCMRKRMKVDEDDYSHLKNHPVARGCGGCYQHGQLCSLMDPGGQYPCQYCREERQKCELLLPPARKAHCECCKARSIACSHLGCGKLDFTQPCLQCQQYRYKCIAGPAHEPGRARVDVNGRPCVVRVPSRRSIVCTPCKEAGILCSLKNRYHGQPPCQQCCAAGKTCVFETEALQKDEQPSQFSRQGPESSESKVCQPARESTSSGSQRIISLRQPQSVTLFEDREQSPIFLPSEEFDASVSKTQKSAITCSAASQPTYTDSAGPRVNPIGSGKTASTLHQDSTAHGNRPNDSRGPGAPASAALSIKPKPFNTNRPIQQSRSATHSIGENESESVEVSGGRIKYILTALCHPVTFSTWSTSVSPQACHWCRSPFFGMVGYCERRRVRVLEWSSRKGCIELSGGHRQAGKEPGRMCHVCTNERALICACERHAMQRIPWPPGKSFDVRQCAQDLKTAAAAAGAHSTADGMPRQQRRENAARRFCSVCNNLAKYACKTPKQVGGGGLERLMSVQKHVDDKDGSSRCSITTATGNISSGSSGSGGGGGGGGSDARVVGIGHGRASSSIGGGGSSRSISIMGCGLRLCHACHTILQRSFAGDLSAMVARFGFTDREFWPFGQRADAWVFARQSYMLMQLLSP